MAIRNAALGRKFKYIKNAYSSWFQIGWDEKQMRYWKRNILNVRTKKRRSDFAIAKP